jgi:hypothetical protein
VAWARCWRLAPQGADWAAGRWAGAAGGADTERSASTRTFEWESEGSESRPESAADSDHAAGGEGDGAAAEIGGPTGAGSERARAGNAGDAVDMALLELPLKCVADPIVLRIFRISSGVGPEGITSVGYDGDRLTLFSAGPSCLGPACPGERPRTRSTGGARARNGARIRVLDRLAAQPGETRSRDIAQRWWRDPEGCVPLAAVLDSERRESRPSRLSTEA